MYTTVGSHTWYYLSFHSFYVRMHYKLTVNPAISSANTATAIKLARPSVFILSALTLMGWPALWLRGHFARIRCALPWYVFGISDVGKIPASPKTIDSNGSPACSTIVRSWFFKISFAPRITLATDLTISPEHDYKYIARVDRPLDIAKVTRISPLRLGGSKRTD